VFADTTATDSDLLGLDPAALADHELTARALEIERLRTRLDAEEAVVLGELDARGTCDRQFGLTTGPWLARDAHLPATVAKARLNVANKLRRHLPVMFAALADGRIGWDHVRVIVDIANPRILDIVAAHQDLLTGLADRCRFERWSTEARSLARMWDQDGGFDPNDDPMRNKFSYGTTIDGLTTLAATLTGENAEVVKQAIETKADALARRAQRDFKACPDLPVPPRSTLRALALTELIRQAIGVDLDTTRGPNTEATLVVGAEDPTSATDPDGVPLADGTVRRLLCDAIFRTLIVDRLGVPLDLGRGARLASDGQRTAVRRRDGGCTFTGCDAKIMWCAVHHCIHDQDGGATDLCNLISLCFHHHGVVHRNGWSVRLDTDGWAIFRTPTGHLFWGQRHGRQREGPPPDPLLGHHETRPAGGTQVLPGRRPSAN
jgi:hypothetical protein